MSTSLLRVCHAAAPLRTKIAQPAGTATLRCAGNVKLKTGAIEALPELFIALSDRT
jgi:hypothetical protein